MSIDTPAPAHPPETTAAINDINCIVTTPDTPLIEQNPYSVTVGTTPLHGTTVPFPSDGKYVIDVDISKSPLFPTFQSYYNPSKFARGKIEGLAAQLGIYTCEHSLQYTPVFEWPGRSGVVDGPQNHLHENKDGKCAGARNGFDLCWRKTSNS